MQFKSASFPWQVVVTIALGVIVPSACLFWMMLRAIENESLALQQKVTEVYQDQLITFNDAWEAYWAELLDSAEKSRMEREGASLFYEIVTQELAESMVNVSGEKYAFYKTEQNLPEKVKSLSSLWDTGEKLEFRERKFEEAGEVYARISALASGVNEKALALVAQARCNIKLNDYKTAIYILGTELADEEFRHSVDDSDRLIQPRAYLLALQTKQKQNDTSSRSEELRIRTMLEKRLSDYSENRMPARQRLFFMRELGGTLPTFSSEMMASRFLSDNTVPINIERQLLPTATPDVWQVLMNDMVLLFSTRFLNRKLDEFLASQRLPRGVGITLVEPVENTSGAKPRVSPVGSIVVGSHMPGWRLSLVVDNKEIDSEQKYAQTAAYVWIMVLFVIVVILLAGLAAHYINRQLSLHKLKNNLISTVSHELKTPLASTRLLVETLLDSDEKLSQRTRDYLQLIDQENKRLTRLVDNFLTFSRMEHNRHIFDFDLVNPKDIVHEALSAMQENLSKLGFEVEVDIAEGLPRIHADQAMMVTVISNLLENACKYSREEKFIRLVVNRDSSFVEFSVVDRGIGISPEHIKRVFDRFYRVDQSLARETEGTGLGLNIVKYIVENHHGNIHVTSQLGAGSTFSIKIPVGGADESQSE